MPYLSVDRNAVMGTTVHGLSYNRNAMSWPSGAPNGLTGQPIFADHYAWLDASHIVMSSAAASTNALYTYDIYTNVLTTVPLSSVSSVSVLKAGGGVWAVSGLGGYEDSLGRTHTTFRVAGVDDDGTVLVILDGTALSGLGYLRTIQTTADEVTVICYDVLDASVPVPATIRGRRVYFHAGSVLRQYNMQTDTLRHSNVPAFLAAHDGEWVVGQHTLGLGCIVWEFRESSGYTLGISATNVRPDVRQYQGGDQLTVVSSVDATEHPQHLRRFVIQTDLSANPRRVFDLYRHKLIGRPVISPTTTPLDPGPGTSTDLITIRENYTFQIDDITEQFDDVAVTFPLTSGGIAVYPLVAQNILVTLGGVTQEPDVAYTVSGSTITFATPPEITQPFFAMIVNPGISPKGLVQRGFASMVNGASVFGSANGQDLRAAAQFGVTAVVSATDVSGVADVTVKDSASHTWNSGAVAYGNNAVYLRPAPTSTTVAPVWEVTWVSGASEYTRQLLNANLEVIGASTTNSSITFGTSGFLSVDTSGTPMAVGSGGGVSYGPLLMQYAVTEGPWTVGVDATPSRPSVPRLVAWNSKTSTAYVVWNANPVYGALTAPPRLALEYHKDGTITAAVVPPGRSLLIRDHQWQPLSLVDIATGKPVGTT